MSPKPDQSASLRHIMENPAMLINWNRRQKTQMWAIGSGKGGVGKSTMAVNLAVLLSELGKKVLLLDSNFGLGNADILLGVCPQTTVSDVLRADKTLEEVIIQLNDRLHLLPTESGDFELANANLLLVEGIYYALENQVENYDIVLFDTGPGLNERTRNNLLFADQTLIISTPEPTSLADSYATIKMILKRDPQKKMQVMINRCRTEGEARVTFEQLLHMSQKYLGRDLDYIGFVPEDEHVQWSVYQQKPFVSCYPKSGARLALLKIAADLAKVPMPETPSPLRNFLQHFMGRDRAKEHGHGMDNNVSE